MKKVDLVHTTILIIALLAAYTGVQELFPLLSTVVYISDIFTTTTQGFGSVGIILLFVLLYTAGCILLIKKGRQLAQYILKDEPEEASWEDAPQINLDRQNLLFVLLIGMGLYTLIQAVPYTVRDLWDMFRSKAGAMELLPSQRSSRSALIIELLRALLGFFLLYAAAPITNLIDKNLASKLKSDS